MLEIFRSLSDDQIALLGCVAALSAAGLTMFFSFYVGQSNRKDVQARIPTTKQTVRLQQQVRKHDKAA